MPWYKNPSLWLKVLVAAFLIILGVRFDPSVSTNGDNAEYLIGAQSLSHGHGYRRLQLPAEPPQSTFPPVTSLYLSPFTKASNLPLLPKIAMGLLGALVLILSYHYFKTKVSALVLWSAMVLLASSHFLSLYSQETMSEVPFMLTVLLALWLYEKSWARPGNRALFLLAVVFSLLPFYTRTVGIALVFALVLASLLRRKYYHALGTAVVFAASYFLYKKAVGGESGYVNILFLKNEWDPEAGTLTWLDLLARAVEGFHKIRTQFTPLLFVPECAYYSETARFFLGNLLFLLHLTGLVWLFIRREWALFLFIPLYYAGICLYATGGVSERYVVAILPLACLLTVIGLHWLLRLAADKFPSALGPRAVPAVLGIPLLWFVLANMTFSLDARDPGNSSSPDWRNYFSCADWIRENTPDSAVIMCRKDNLFYLRAHRKSRVYPYTHNVENIYKFIDENHVDYVVYDGFFWTSTSLKFLYPAIINQPQKFKLVYYLQNPDTYILQVVK